MEALSSVLLIFYILSGYLVDASSDLCTYNPNTTSQYVQCFEIKQRPPYACDSNGGSQPDEYQIHILETDLDHVVGYNESSPPDIWVVINPLSANTDTSQTIVLVFHSFKPVTWHIYSELFPVGTNFIIKSSYPLIIDPLSILAKTPVDLMTTLPKDSETVIRTIESYYRQRITSFNGFHEGSRINWFIGPGNQDNACTINPHTLTKRIEIFKEISVSSSGCTVPNGLGYNTHIIDVDKTHGSDFPFAKHFATLIVKSKSYNDEFYGSNVVLILKSKKSIEWTIDTSGMDGNVLVVVINGMSQTPSQSNLKVQTVVGSSLSEDATPQEFINYISETYGVVASYTKAEMANHIIIEVPEVIIPNMGNTTETPHTEPLPDIDEIIASVDGQKSVKCYRETVVVSWPMSLLDSLYVQDVYFVDDESSDCRLQMMSSQGTLLSGYDECGFTAEHSLYSSTYEAMVAVSLIDGRHSQIRIQCRIYNTTTLSAAPKDQLYHLSIYGDQDYTKQISEFNVPNNGYVYFKADLKDITDPNMSAIVEECFLSPNRDNFLDRHVLISHTCPLDNTIHFLNQNVIGIRDDKAQKIKFRMSQYFMNTNDYYLHCKVTMCSKITTPDIPRCSNLYQLCKRDPPELEELQAGVEQDYILAGPIYLQNITSHTDYNNQSRIEPCRNGPGAPNNSRTTISMGLLIGIALGSFALGIILTVFAIHCVTMHKKRVKLPPTDIFRFENRQAENLYEPIKIYDVCPQGHHLNRTTHEPEPSSSA